MGILCRELLCLVAISLTVAPIGAFAGEGQMSSQPEAGRLRINDIVLNRGKKGLWTHRNKKTLKRVFPSRPISIAVGRLSGGNRDSILFGVSTPPARRGTWTLKITDITPQRIDTRAASHVAVGDFDGNGVDDIITSFQGQSGTHLRMNGGSFFQVHNSTPNAVAAGDLDGNGLDDVIISLSNGIFTCYDALAPWIMLHPRPAQNIAVGDIDGDGRADLIIDRGAKGIWKRMNNAGTFTRINIGNPIQIGIADPDGNGRDGVLASFPNGLFFSPNGGNNWSRINTHRPIDFTVADFNNDRKDDIVVIDPSSGVLYRQNNAGAWRPLPGLPKTGITDVVGAGLDGQ